jgi:hypothetical protein
MYRKMIGFVCIVIFSLSMIACSEKSTVPLAVPLAVPLKVFKQEITAPAPPQTLKVNEKVNMQVTVKNTGNESWPNKGSDQQGSNVVALQCIWLDSAGKTVEEGAGYGNLPNVLMPESSVNLVVNVQAPRAQGDYKLRCTMYQHGVAFFNDKGANPLLLKVKVN